MKKVLSVLMIIAVSAGLCSCQSGPQSRDWPAGVVSSAEGGLDSAALAYELSQKKWCSNDDACALMLHLVDGADESKSFAQRLDTLKAKAIVPQGWNLTADQAVSKGTTAYMLCRALNIKGGLLMQVFPGRRYAYREAVYREIMRKGSEYEPLTGPEAVGIIGRAARMTDAVQ